MSSVVSQASQSFEGCWTDKPPTDYIVRAAAIWALSRLLPPEDFAALAVEHAPREADGEVRAEWSAA